MIPKKSPPSAFAERRGWILFRMLYCAFLLTTPRIMKGTAMVMRVAAGRQIQGLGIKPASRKETKEITATVPA